MSFTNEIYQHAKNIRCLICDVDGVLTDGKVYLDNQQGELKAFNIKDGLGITQSVVGIGNGLAGIISHCLPFCS